jgi:hypothetical protein
MESCADTTALAKRQPEDSNSSAVMAERNCGDDDGPGREAALG